MIRSLAGKTLLITGASRGIGLAIALRAARDGANIIVAAKTERPHPTLAGTIYTASREIERAGGQALPVAMNLRYEDQIQAAVEAAIARFGAIDILINNATALYRETTEATATKHFDLLFEVNVRGTWLITKACLPHLRGAPNPHVLSIAPPVGAPSPADFAASPAFAISKYNMSLMTMAMAHEFEAEGIGFNAVWPSVAVWTAANHRQHGDGNQVRSRRPEVMAEAAWHIVTQDAARFSGNLMLDDQVLCNAGVDLDAFLYPGADPDNMFPVTLFANDAQSIDRTA